MSCPDVPALGRLEICVDLLVLVDGDDVPGEPYEVVGVCELEGVEGGGEEDVEDRLQDEEVKEEGGVSRTFDTSRNVGGIVIIGLTMDMTAAAASICGDLTAS